MSSRAHQRQEQAASLLRAAAGEPIRAICRCTGPSVGADGTGVAVGGVAGAMASRAAAQRIAARRAEASDGLPGIFYLAVTDTRVLIFGEHAARAEPDPAARVGAWPRQAVLATDRRSRRLGTQFTLTLPGRRPVPVKAVTGGFAAWPADAVDALPGGSDRPKDA